MPYRSTTLFWAVFGSVLVLALILLGRDLRRAAQTGPGWKRRLVATGLVLLGAIGFTAGFGGCSEPGGGSAYSSTGFTDPIPPGQGLEETAHWDHLTDVWREAEEIGSGKRGDYPFDEKGKKQILDQLATVATNLGRLQAAGLLSKPEAGLLGKELALVTGRVQAKRPTEMRNATCYEPMAFSPARDSLVRLADRLPLLEKLAASETIQPQVVSKVLDTVEKDLAVLDQKQMRDQLPEGRKAEAEKIVRETRSQVEKIRKHLRGQLGALETSKPWGEIADAWKAAVPLATSGRSTTAQREAVDRKIESAKHSALELAAWGMLSKAEAELLVSEAGRLRDRIYANPPTDCQVTCYDMAYIPPAQQSFERLSRRLPLLEQLAAEGQIHPAALRKVLGSIEEDIQMLSDEKSLESLRPGQRAEAEKMHANAEAAVAEIKRILKGSE